MNLNRDWSYLPEEVLFEIVKKTQNSYIDNLRLRSICNLWRSHIPPFQQNLSFNFQIPFPISSTEEIDVDRRCCFLRESTIYLVESFVSDQTPTTCLIKVSGKIPHGKLIHLNPLFGYPHNFKGVPKKLPETLNLMDFRVFEISKAYHLDLLCMDSWHFAFMKVVLSQTDCRILAIRGTSGKNLCSWKLGDQVWTVIRYEPYHYFKDIIHYKGKFYAVDDKMVVLVIDESSLELIRVIEPPLNRAPYYHQGRKHLVESSGDLFLILELGIRYHFRLKKLDENGFTWEWVDILGDQVLFLCSYSESSDTTHFEDNSICFLRKDAVKTMSGVWTKLFETCSTFFLQIES